MNSTSWFVAVAGFAAAAMTLWILLDLATRNDEGPFRPFRESADRDRESQASSRSVKSDPGTANTRTTRARAGATPSRRQGHQGTDEVPPNAELDLDYIDALRGSTRPDATARRTSADEDN